MTIQHRQAAAVQPNRVVVLGSSGFVGSDLVTHLRVQGINTLALSSKEMNLLEHTSVHKLATQPPARGTRTRRTAPSATA
jgi:nucleoside-diphosphate-sugar epimerase